MMQEIQFFKYQGAGNDFIIIDNRTLKFEINNKELIAALCNRRFGIGADGLMLLEKSMDTDFEMLYYNADGQLGSLCGNGARCIVSFAKKLGVIKSETTFRAVDGLHYAKINEEGDYVSLQMNDVSSFDKNGEDYIVNTGSPHYVKLVNELESYDVYTEGMAIRNNKLYKQDGINVNFVEAISDVENKANCKKYFVRTFERGVEDETLACGTGVTAVAIAMAIEHKLNGEVETLTQVKGGDLKVKFLVYNNHFTQIYLEGPASFVFEGRINPSREI